MQESAHFSCNFDLLCLDHRGPFARWSVLNLVCNMQGAIQRPDWNSPLSTSFPLAPRQGHGSVAGNSWERWDLEYGFLSENEQMDTGHVGWGSCESSGHQRHVEALKIKKVCFPVLRVFIFNQERFICNCVKLFCEFMFCISSRFSWVTT